MKRNLQDRNVSTIWNTYCYCSVTCNGRFAYIWNNLVRYFRADKFIQETKYQAHYVLTGEELCFNNLMTILFIIVSFIRCLVKITEYLWLLIHGLSSLWFCRTRALWKLRVTEFSHRFLNVFMQITLMNLNEYFFYKS